MNATRRLAICLFASTLALPHVPLGASAVAAPVFVKDGLSFRIDKNSQGQLQPGGQRAPALTVREGNGGFIATWLNYRSAADQRAFARFFSSGGIPVSDFSGGGQMGSTTGPTAGTPAVSARPVSFANDSSLILFSADRRNTVAAHKRDIFGQRMGSGPWLPVGDPVIVNQVLANAQDSIHAVRLLNGRVLSAFLSHAAAASTFDIKGRIVNSGAAPVGGEKALTVNTVGMQIPTSLAALTNGGAVLAYVVRTGARQDVFVQRLSAAGDRVGQPYLLKRTTSANTFGGAGVAPLSAGRYIALWFTQGAVAGTAALRGCIFSAAGVAGALRTIGSARITPTLLTVPKIAVSPQGEIVVITDGFFNGVSSLDAWLLTAAAVRQLGPVKLITSGPRLTSESLLRLPNRVFVMSWTQSAASPAATRAMAQRFRVNDCDRC
jgi:hypothetical protein